MKKLLALTLTLIMAFMMLPSVMAASTTPTMTMSSSSGHDVGDTVTLEISFDYGQKYSNG